MSRFKVITGDNISSIVNQNREIEQLKLAIDKKLNPSDRDLVVYAYHFSRLNNPLLAQKYLNKLSPEYFNIGVYKDLSHALLIWSLNAATGGSMPPKSASIYEYFIILKRALQMFESVSFNSKPAFLDFKKQFFEFTSAHGT